MPRAEQGGNSARGLLGRLRSSAVSPRRSTGRINPTWSDEGAGRVAGQFPSASLSS
jgi:hypothetical protein